MSWQWHFSVGENGAILKRLGAALGLALLGVGRLERNQRAKQLRPAEVG